MDNPDPLAAKRAKLIGLMTAAGKSPIERDRNGIIRCMPESVLDDLIENYSPSIRAPGYVW